MNLNTYLGKVKKERAAERERKALIESVKTDVLVARFNEELKAIAGYMCAEGDAFLDQSPEAVAAGISLLDTLIVDAENHDDTIGAATGLKVAKIVINNCTYEKNNDGVDAVGYTVVEVGTELSLDEFNNELRNMDELMDAMGQEMTDKKIEERQNLFFRYDDMISKIQTEVAEVLDFLKDEVAKDNNTYEDKWL